MKVSDVMSKNPYYVGPDTSVTDAKALMNKEKIHKLPVLDSNNQLVGVITKNDLLKAGPSEATTLDIYEMGYLLSKLKVEKVMTKNPIVVQSDEVVEVAAREMSDNGIGCLPVMKGELLVGIITQSDLFRTFVDMFGARHHGVRATFTLADHKGELANLSRGIADAGGNIVSFITSEGDDLSKRFITARVTDISIDKLQQILTEYGINITDIREV